MGRAYAAEAELLQQGMNELLWVPEQGAFGESKDLMEPQTVYTNPALWTVYHTIDSEVPTPKQAWQMAAERLAQLRHVPIHGEGVPDGDWTMLSCSDWLPYMWSLNLLLLGENAHMALALWQTGMRDEAYRIFKGAMLDSMYMGLCPGDFHMTSALDVHRQEAQRDFGDPIGISSRALVEGLFGVQPDLIADEVRIRPGFPSNWNHASLKHKDFDFTWRRDGLHETYEFTSRLAKEVPLTMTLPARTTSLPAATCNGRHADCAFDAAAVGEPMLTLHLPAARSNRVSIEWHGSAPLPIPARRSYRVDEELELPHGVAIGQIDDPLQLVNGHVAVPGFHTVFADMHQGDCAWSMPIHFEAIPSQSQFAPVPELNATPPGGAQVDLSRVLKDRVTEIFTRLYRRATIAVLLAGIPRQSAGRLGQSGRTRNGRRRGIARGGRNVADGAGRGFCDARRERTELPVPLPLGPGPGHAEGHAPWPRPRDLPADGGHHPAAVQPDAAWDRIRYLYGWDRCQARPA